MKKILLSIMMLTAGCFSASAQEAKNTKEVFNPHWYVQAQGGIQETLGEVGASDLLSGNAQIAVGYKFTSVLGARLTVGAWQSKGGSTIFDKEYTYQWNYVAPTLNVTLDLTNALFGFKPRVVNVGVFAGVGANIGMNNDEIPGVRKCIQVANPDLAPNDPAFMQYEWTGTKVRAVGQFGVNVDFNITKRVALGLEANANVLSDRYNSKKADNLDWYFNTLAGVKVALGKTTKTVPVKVNERVIERERIIEKIKTDTVYIKEKAEEAAPLRRDIFYPIRISDISQEEMAKVKDVADYLNSNPSAKVTITGYADKGTGNPKINMKYARQRAENVAQTLTSQFGISKNRIKVEAAGDTVQPYEQAELNRVSICIAK